MDMVHFTLKGSTPLLLSSPESMGEDLGALSTEDQAEKLAYRFPDKSLCFPAIGVRNSMMAACKGVTVRPKEIGRARGTRPLPILSFVMGSILLADEFFPLVDDSGKPLREYNIDLRRVAVGQGVRKAFIRRARPKLFPWFVVCAFRYNPILNIEPIRDILNYAGQTVGIGGYRIEKGGPFGSFEVVEVRVIRETGEEIEVSPKAQPL